MSVPWEQHKFIETRHRKQETMRTGIDAFRFEELLTI